MWNATINSNMNFPAPAAVLGFLAAAAGLVLGALAVLVALFLRKNKIGGWIAKLAAAGAVFYFLLLSGFSLGSRTKNLSRGEEKYFCEIDCHLAYAVLDVHETKVASFGNGEQTARGTFYVVTLRTRFDERTISPQRPKDAPLTPNPRVVRLLDAKGAAYEPVRISGPALLTPLKPGDSYTTQLVFDVPWKLENPRLLVTSEGWPERWLIGGEGSWGHGKTYFTL
jgi:hypothetical protein